MDHSEEIPVPKPPIISGLEDYGEKDVYLPDQKDAIPPGSTFNQGELNDLCRDLGLSKDSSELLASRLKVKKLLDPGTNVCYFRKREQDYLEYFDSKSKVVFCTNVEKLL